MLSANKKTASGVEAVFDDDWMFWSVVNCY
jgi:hypothetical protein